MTILQTAVWVKVLLSDAPNFLTTFSKDIINYFPNELIVNIKNGQIITNVKEPYFISSPDQKDFNNLLVIDTKTSFTATQFNQYQTIAWLNKDSLFYRTGGSDIRAFDLSQIREFKVDKNFVSLLINQFTPWIKFTGPILLALAFLGIYLIYLFYLVYLTFISLLIWALGRIFGWGLSFAGSYKIGLHAITLALLVDLTLSLLRPWLNITGFPFMVAVITLGVVILNLKSYKNTPS